MVHGCLPAESPHRFHASTGEFTSYTETPEIPQGPQYVSRSFIHAYKGRREKYF